MTLENITRWINCDKVEIILYGNDGADNQEKVTGQKAKDIFMNELVIAIELDIEGSI